MRRPRSFRIGQLRLTARPKAPSAGRGGLQCPKRRQECLVFDHLSLRADAVRPLETDKPPARRSHHKRLTDETGGYLSTKGNKDNDEKAFRRRSGAGTARHDGSSP